MKAAPDRIASLEAQLASERKHIRELEKRIKSLASAAANWLFQQNQLLKRIEELKHANHRD